MCAAVIQAQNASGPAVHSESIVAEIIHPCCCLLRLPPRALQGKLRLLSKFQGIALHSTHQSTRWGLRRAKGRQTWQLHCLLE